MKKEKNSILPKFSIIISLFALAISGISVYFSYKQYNLREYEFQEERLPIWEGTYNEKHDSLILKSVNNDKISINRVYLYYYDFSVREPQFEMRVEKNEIPLNGLKKYIKESGMPSDITRNIPYYILISTYYFYKSNLKEDNSLYMIYFETNKNKNLIYVDLKYEMRLKKMDFYEIFKFLKTIFEDERIFVNKSIIKKYEQRYKDNFDETYDNK